MKTKKMCHLKQLPLTFVSLLVLACSYLTANAQVQTQRTQRLAQAETPKAEPSPSGWTEPDSKTESKKTDEKSAPSEFKESESPADDSETSSEKSPTSEKDDVSEKQETPEKTSPETSSKDTTQVTRQKLCQILIQTKDMNLLLLKQGALLDLKKGNLTFVARVNRVATGRIIASLRKKDCPKNVVGASVSKRTGPVADIQSKAPPANLQSEEETKPIEEPTIIRKSDDGFQVLAGFSRLSVPNLNLDNFVLRPTYEWVLGPNKGALRRKKEGPVLGLGLSLVDIQNYTSTELQKGSQGFINLRVGYRSASNTFGVTAAPFLNYLLYTKISKNNVIGIEYFPEKPVHRIGLEIQTDYSIADDMRLALAANYVVIFINNPIPIHPTLVEILTGVWMNF